jgi:hypothetical protein
LLIYVKLILPVLASTPAAASAIAWAAFRAWFVVDIPAAATRHTFALAVAVL